MLIVLISFLLLINSYSNRNLKLQEDLQNQTVLINQLQKEIQNIQEKNEQILKENNRLLKQLNDINQKYSVNIPMKDKLLIIKESKKYNMQPELLFGLIEAESTFNPNAVSPCGAIGYGQIMPSTGKWIYERELKLGEFSPDKLFNPETNIKIAAWYLNYHVSRGGTRNIGSYHGGTQVTRDGYTNRILIKAKKYE